MGQGRRKDMRMGDIIKNIGRKVTIVGVKKKGGIEEKHEDVNERETKVFGRTKILKLKKNKWKYWGQFVAVDTDNQVLRSCSFYLPGRCAKE
jgi:hypothetical protein